MNTALSNHGADEAALRSERARLVRLCYRFTGNLDAAQDLAQETLFEAVRNSHKLRDPSGYSKWLSAIARHVCARWNERHGREMTHRLIQHEAPGGSADDDADELDFVDVDYDLDIELDRRELVTLLDRAMALLPAETREVLVARYVQGSPHAEIAKKLGLSGPNVAKRLERGRLRLKQVLSTHLLHEAAAYGLADRLYDDWDETTIWCATCGRRRLLAKRMPNGRIWLICKPCIVPVNQFATVATHRGIRGYAANYARDFEEHDRRYASGIAGQVGRCCHCGALLPYGVGVESFLYAMHYASTWCARCRDGMWNFSATWHLLATAEGRQFQHEYPRLRFLPDREIEANGVPALIVSVESMTGRAKIEGIFARDTFARLGMHVTPGT